MRIHTHTHGTTVLHTRADREIWDSSLVFRPFVLLLLLPHHPSSHPTAQNLTATAHLQVFLPSSCIGFPFLILLTKKKEEGERERESQDEELRLAKNGTFLSKLCWIGKSHLWSPLPLHTMARLMGSARLNCTHPSYSYSQSASSPTESTTTTHTHTHKHRV